MSPLRHPIGDLERIVDRLVADIGPRGTRYVLGITGPPGAGKSTIAAEIVEHASAQMPSCVAPMDGFHRTNAALATAGLLPLKGIPPTFDGEAFVAALRCIRAKPRRRIPWPTYDRNLQEAIVAGTTIAPIHRLVVVEGNYLLMDDPPWDEVRPLLDAVWYLDVPTDVLVPRLLARHGRHRSAAAAAEKVTSTDLPNTALVAATRHRADVILTMG